MKPQDMKDLQELIEFLKQYQVAEFDLDRGDTKIRLKFAQPAAPSAGIADIATLRRSRPPHQLRARAFPSQRHRAAPPADPDAGLHIVKSPIVGTYYGSPSPGAAAIRLSRRSRRKRPGHLHRRSHEADERDRVRRLRRNREMLHHQRPAHRIRSTPLFHSGG